MATVLNDIELKKLFGTIILKGDESCLRPNSYILRMGDRGEYLNTNKKFSIGDEKQGIKIPPGHSVGLTSYEDIDFTREKVHKIYPGHDLHALITPTTDLSREGIVASATQIDAGYNGTLNWTLVNTSNQERRYLYKTEGFRMTILKLSEGEVPLKPYDGHYHKQFGYVKSKRRDAPVGMEDAEWETAFIKGGPEDLLEVLAKAGPPWNVLSERLTIIDNKFETVHDEYKNIKDSIDELKTKITKIDSYQDDIIKKMESAVTSVIEKGFPAWEDRWILKVGKILLGTFGLIMIITSNNFVMNIIKDNHLYVGLGLLLIVILWHFIKK